MTNLSLGIISMDKGGTEKTVLLVKMQLLHYKHRFKRNNNNKSIQNTDLKVWFWKLSATTNMIQFKSLLFWTPFCTRVYKHPVYYNYFWLLFLLTITIQNNSSMNVISQTSHFRSKCNNHKKYHKINMSKIIIHTGSSDSTSPISEIGSISSSKKWRQTFFFFLRRMTFVLQRWRQEQENSHT